MSYSAEKMGLPKFKKMVRNFSTFNSNTENEVKLIIANYIKDNPAIENE